jgi:ribosome recycling factor
MVRSLKEDGLSEDAIKDAEDQVQKLTDKFNNKVDDLVSNKEIDIMKV